MAGRWKPPKEDRTDAETVRRKKELAEKLAFAVEYGTEEEFVVDVKKFKPDVGKGRTERLDYAVSRRPAREARALDFIYNFVEFPLSPAELFGRHAFSRIFHQIAEGIDQRLHRGLRLWVWTLP